jgi:hypothetical protein
MNYTCSAPFTLQRVHSDSAIECMLSFADHVIHVVALHECMALAG